MKKKIYATIAFLCLTACSSLEKENSSLLKSKRKKEEVTSQILKEKQILTLEEAIQLAKERNIALQQKELEREMAKLEKKISFANFLPHISTFYNRNFWEEPLQANIVLPSSLGSSLAGVLPPSLSPLLSSIPKQLEGRLVDKTFEVYGIQASFPIFVPATWFLYSARQKGEDLSKMSYQLSEQMLMLKVIQEYYWILSLEAEKQQLQLSLEAAKELEKNTKIALETESILKWQYEKSLAFLKQKEFAWKQNQKDLQLAKMNLLKTLNLDPFHSFEVEVPKKEQGEKRSLEDTVYQALLESDALKMRRKSIEIQEEKIKIAFSKFLPLLGVSGMYANQGISFLQPTHILFASLMGTFSLFHGFQDVNQYKKEKLQKKSLLLKEEEEILQLMLETTNTYWKWESSLEEKEIADINFQAEKGKFHQKKIEKQVGMISQLEYLNALQEYEKSISLQWKAEYQYQVYQEVLDMLVKRGRFADQSNRREQA